MILISIDLLDFRQSTPSLTHQSTELQCVHLIFESTHRQCVDFFVQIRIFHDFRSLHTLLEILGDLARDFRSFFSHRFFGRVFRFLWFWRSLNFLLGAAFLHSGHVIIARRTGFGIVGFRAFGGAVLFIAFFFLFFVIDFFV